MNNKFGIKYQILFLVFMSTLDFLCSLNALPFGHAELQGKRPSMEDAYQHIQQDENGILFFGLFDGHGGSKVSHFLADNLGKNILNDQAIADNPVNALIKGYEKTHNDLIENWAYSQGSTAVSALIYNNTIYVANVGDSRAVLCSNGKAVELSSDHKPNRVDEHNRIINLGGEVVWHGCWRVQGVLALSRAMGDKKLAPYVIAEPEIVTHTIINKNDEFLILACDGVWDVLTNQEAVEIVKRELNLTKNPETAAKILVQKAYDSGSADNISAMIVIL